MRTAYILAFFTIAFCQKIEAQTFTVKGLVLSSEDNTPLIGATLVEQGTSNATTTDLDGKFILQIASGASVLEISYVGFERLVVPVQNRKEIEVRLAPESNLIEEIIVTGYRSEIRGDISSAIATVKGKDIGKLVVSGIDQALQGQAPGVMVTQVTGSPGDDIAVRIRGSCGRFITGGRS